MATVNTSTPTTSTSPDPIAVAKEIAAMIDAEMVKSLQATGITLPAEASYSFTKDHGPHG
jgi:hypothetical protein